LAPCADQVNLLLYDLQRFLFAPENHHASKGRSSKEKEEHTRVNWGAGHIAAVHRCLTITP